MIDPKDVTIIIPHLGNNAEGQNTHMEYAMEQTLQSLRETVPDIRVVVAKNGDFACSHSYGVDVNIRPQGQCRAVNAAVAITDTPWIFVTNDDMIYPPGWFEKLTNAGGGTRGIYADDPRVFCLSPKLIEPITGAPTFEQYFCGGAGGDFNKQKWLEFAASYPEQAFPMRTGFNLPFLIKRELWDTIGGYDNSYDPWGSNGDSDLQAKIHLAGVQPYQNTNCVVYHFSQTSGTSHPSNRPYWERNWHYFIKKWGFERASAPDVWISKAIIDYEKLIYKPDWMKKYGEVA